MYTDEKMAVLLQMYEGVGHPLWHQNHMLQGLDNARAALGQL